MGYLWLWGGYSLVVVWVILGCRVGYLWFWGRSSLVMGRVLILVVGWVLSDCGKGPNLGCGMGHPLVMVVVVWVLILVVGGCYFIIRARTIMLQPHTQGPMGAC